MSRHGRDGRPLRAGRAERHERFEELISASLTGDLSDAEQAALDAHLARCATCRATLDAFATGRRRVAGLRRIAPPRDLGARVWAGIEAEEARAPWWRRPGTVFGALTGVSALAAGVLLALVLAREAPQQVGRTTPTPSPAMTPSASVLPSGAPLATPVATPPPGETPVPGPIATPAPEPNQYLALALPTTPPEPAATPPPEVASLTVNEVESGEPAATLPPVSGPPVAAALAPDGEWLAYLTAASAAPATNEAEPTGPGTAEVWLSREADKETLQLASGLEGSTFFEQLSWSPDGRYLAYAVLNAEPAVGDVSDVWLLDTDDETLEPRRLTLTGTGVAGSFDADGALWVSVVAEQPASFRLPSDALEAASELDADALAETADVTLSGWFQPLVAPDGSALTAWRGAFDPDVASAPQPIEDSPPFSFAGSAAPYLIVGDPSDQEAVDSAVPLFADLAAEDGSFRSAAIAWGPNSKVVAVWATDWQPAQPTDGDGTDAGGSAADAGAYPDPQRVYLGRVNQRQPIHRGRALDADDLPRDIERVIDVAVAPDGVHLAITVSYPPNDQTSAPRADLILVKRNLGAQPDEKMHLVETDGWEGPAVYAPGVQTPNQP
jgi:hypothetical protein